MPSHELTSYLTFAKSVVRQGGQETLKWFRNPAVRVETKASDHGFDPVTEADQACERIIRQGIAETWPEHGIVGEEFEDVSGNAWTWFVDPIDGTRTFVTGALHWGVLLALCYHGEPVLGVMYQPFTDELFTGVEKRSEYCRGSYVVPMHCRSCSGLDQSIVLSSHPDLFVNEHEQTVRAALRERVRMLRYGGDCYQYALLAMGHADLVVESQLKPWDILALIPIVKGAGGVITNWDGASVNTGGQVVASGTQKLHEQTLELIDSVANQ